MKKHFLYLSTAAVLAMSFASCVDNDEPRGLRELRYAKANQWNAEAEWKRTLTSTDSAMAVLKNKYQELVNIKKEADDNYDIACKKCSLALMNAEYDVKIAEQKYNLAKYSDQVIAEKAKEELAKAQKNLLVAQKDLDDANRAYEVNKKENEKLIAAKEAWLKDELLKIQDQLKQYELDQAEYTAKWKAQTYKENLENLLIIAAAKKEAWYQNKHKVDAAYSDLIAKEDSMVTAQENVYKAQQKLLIEMNNFENDSTDRLKELNRAVEDKEYAWKWAQREVEWAQTAYNDFIEDTSNTGNWVRKYNSYDDAVKGYDDQDAQLRIKIVEAKAKKTADSLDYVEQKEEIEKPLKEYDKTTVYRTFTINDAIAFDKKGNDKLSNANIKVDGKDNAFKVEKGVIANADPVKKGDLHKYLDPILKEIGNDNQPGLYKTAAGLKTVQGEIDGYTEKIAKKEAEINRLKQDTLTLRQQQNELKAQNQIVKKEEEDLKAFNKAVTEYKAAALAYKYSDNKGKSTYYDEVYDGLVKLVKEFNDKWVEEYKKDADNVYKKDGEVTKKRKAVQEAVNNSTYWNLRTKFDGTVLYEKEKDGDKGEYFANIKWSTADDAAYAAFDGFLKVFSAADGSDYNANANYTDPNKTGYNNAIENKVKYLIGANTRASKDGGAWKTYFDAAEKLLGTGNINPSAPRYEAYNLDEIEEFYNTKPSSVLNSSKGTMGEYYEWVYAINKYNKDIADKVADAAKAADDPSTDGNGDYTNPGIKQLKELRAEKQAEYDNNGLWKDLYNEIYKEVEAYDNDTKKLKIAQQKGYETTLADIEKDIFEDEQTLSNLDLEQGWAKKAKGYNENLRDIYKSLIDALKLKDNNNVAMKVDDIQAEIIIDFAVIKLQNGINTAQRKVEDAEIELNKAKKNLADFKAGEYSVDGVTYNSVKVKNDYYTRYLEAEEAVNAAKLKYEQAVKKYEVAKAYYEDVLEAFAEEI